MSTKWKISERYARTVFYQGDAAQFLEAVLNISEKVRGLAGKVVGDLKA